jgi:hypothetical protein
MMNYRNDDERGETFVRSVGFLDDCEDALSAIDAAKVRAAREIKEALTRLRDICRQQMDNVGAGNIQSDHALIDAFVSASEDGSVDMADEIASIAESAIRAEMEG